MKRWPTALLLLFVTITAQAGDPVHQGRVEAGRVYLEFNTDLLRRMGARVLVPRPVDEAGPGALPVWESAGSDLSFAVRGGGFRYLVAGKLETTGGLTLQAGARVIDTPRLTLRAIPDTLFFTVSDDAGRPLFRLLNTHARLDPESGDLSFRHMDIQVTAELAAWLGHPRYAGVTVGEAHMETVTSVAPEWLAEKGESCGVLDTDGDVDVQLTNIGSTSETAREEGVRVALAPDASLKNVGTADVPWFRAINPDGGPRPPFGQHPFLVTNAYRIMDGVIEQIGRSDAKHAFFTVNVGADCVCPGGQILHLNCQDIYGVSSNSDRQYLAPRDEITANGGDWHSFGSHFDVYPNEPMDDFRDHSRGDHADSFEHRLVVAEEDLLAEDAEFFIEAWYVIADDINILNSMGNRRIDPSLQGNAWTFTPFLSEFKNGPAIDRWVDPDAPGPGARNTWVETFDGHLKLAVRTAALGGGNYRYDYALMNLDYDRRVRSVEIPVPVGISVTQLRFGDVDDDPANDWSAERDASSVRWIAGNPKRTALDWGTLYHFGFNANAAPVEVQAALTPLEARSGLKGEYTPAEALTLAPGSGSKLQPPAAAH